MMRYTIDFVGRNAGEQACQTFADVAHRHPVAGYVAPAEQGRVRLVAEGEPMELDDFLEALHEQTARHLERRNLQKSSATGEFGSPLEDGTFQVRPEVCGGD
ncbi:MAG: acylphosphatase [Phycisphaeraceae bacterium]